MTSMQKMDRKRIVGLIAVAVAVLVIVIYAIFGRSQPQPQTIAVGANLPLTGFLAEYGAAVKDGATMAADELATADPAGPRFRFDWQDNASDSKTAITVVQKQMLQPPNVYISGIGPSLVAPIMDKVAPQGTPHFVWTFDVVLRKDGKPNSFRTNVSYKIEPAMFVEYAKRRSAKRVAILYLLLPHAVEEFQTVVIPGLKREGVTDVMAEQYAVGKSDFVDLAVKIKEFKPDLLILNGFQMDLVNMVKAFRPQGLITDGNTIATYDMMDTTAILGAAELEGIRAVVPAYIVSPSEKAAAWTKRFVARYGRKPIYTNAFGYDAMTIITDAGRRLNLPASSTDWQRAIAATNIEGITGPLRFDDGGDLRVPLAIAVLRNGKFVPDVVP